MKQGVMKEFCIRYILKYFIIIYILVLKYLLEYIFCLNNGNTGKSQTNQFWYGFLIAALTLEPDFVQLPSYSFWGNWVLEMVIKICCNFRSCILVILTISMRVRWSLSEAFAFFSSFASVRRFFLLSQKMSLLLRQHSFIHQIIFLLH